MPEPHAITVEAEVGDRMHGAFIRIEIAGRSDDPDDRHTRQRMTFYGADHAEEAITKLQRAVAGVRAFEAAFSAGEPDAGDE